MAAAFDFRLAAAEVASRHGTSVAAIVGPARQAAVVRARHALMAACRDAGWTDVRIAEALAMDPTSVGHGIRRHRRRCRLKKE